MSAGASQSRRCGGRPRRSPPRGQAAVEDGEGLRVADRRQAPQRVRVAARPDGGGLFDETGVELRAGAVGDPFAVRRRIHGESQPDRRPRVAPCLGQRRVALELGDLEGSHDPARVAEVDGAGEPGRQAAQTLDERGETLCLELQLDVRAERRVGRNLVQREPARDGPQVQARAADEDRDAVLGRRFRGAPRRRDGRSRRR